MRRKAIKLSHYAIKGILYLMWAAIAFQAVIYFVNPIRVQSYSRAVQYWTTMWKVFHSG